ncbi:MAG: sugar phosphate isomerase/epimerase [Lentisphaerae bacterium]|jgi:sugar phosphate isomerase/epimerase|nr:sugar phosphate isomerase/epimerase [Lentisphaerota bacterium]MBT4820835.1 sugar phosphate isomerase/epimerase [Lentisphaerota bacterium]MBT5612269.1 sugar phosphate isomerase/epimerase [Lentisphaerota bacterium]MBT7060753.1 sugar phosphate isomerase/epimerase [Lentisphaerota bacterium]MBT7845248.1 sugar phosphate isomerase/epimerase [Lentisphaerota bacterium]
MAPPIIMHCNFCEQGQTVEEMCCRAASWGYDGVEFRRTRRAEEETVDEYLGAIAAGVEKSGLKQVVFGGPGGNFMTPDADIRASELDSMVAFYRLAAERFDLTVCNTMAGPLLNPAKGVTYSDYHCQGSAVAQSCHWEWATEGFKVLGALAEELGFRLAFESHMGYLHDLPEPARKLVDMIDSPAVGINLDYGNAIHFPQPVPLADAISQCGDRLYFTHLKNYATIRGTGGRLAAGLADGDINNREFMRLLMDSGYDGPLCIEAPRAGDREWFAQQDLAYLQAVLQDLGW